MNHPYDIPAWRAHALSSFALLLLLTGAAVSPAPAATVTRGPYLQKGTHTNVVVRWRTDVATDSGVRYGNSPSTLTAFAQNLTVTTEHEVDVTRLSPDTQYYYSVGTTATTLAGGDSTYFWITFPSPGTPVPTRVWVLGDPGTQSAAQLAVRDAYYNATGTRHTDLWLMLGDNAYQNGTDVEYQGAVFNVYPTMLRKSVLFSALGNHDTAQSTAFVDTYPYFDMFTFPKNGECGGLASGTEHYYSFDFGNIHFISLDSMTADRSPGGPMATWLQNDLGATPRQWIVAFWHHPPYSKGSHNSDTETELVQMRENINPILEANGVDLVLGGHSHDYERTYLIDRHYNLSSTFDESMKTDGGSGRDPAPYLKPTNPVSHAGAVYTVAGSSGQTSGGSLDHPAMFVSLNVLGSLVLDFTTNRLDVQFLDSAGVVRDTYALLKDSSAPPFAPTGLAATPGNNRADLEWNNTSTATSYVVKRSGSSGGPYNVIASGVTTSAYADTTAAGGTTYYYVVSAVNSNGEGPNSAQVSATPTAPTPPQPPTALVARASNGKKKISLTWTQSSSPNIISNKIYRATVSGGPYSLIASVAATTTYNNTGLTSGATYYYVVTALNAAGVESTASNQAFATAR